MKIGVVLPTYCDKNTPDEWKFRITRYLDSLVHLSCVDNLEFLINFQGITEELIQGLELDKKILEVNPTWSYKYSINSYDTISMVVIRNDCMRMDLDCDLYLYHDDDMKCNKGTGECYNATIKEFEKNSKLGLVCQQGNLGGYFYKGVHNYTPHTYYWTSRGLFIRNLKISKNSPIYSEYCLSHHKGGGEDYLPKFIVLAKDYETAKFYNNPMYHKPQFNYNTNIPWLKQRLEAQVIKEGFEKDTAEFTNRLEEKIKEYNIKSKKKNTPDVIHAHYDTSHAALLLDIINHDCNIQVKLPEEKLYDRAMDKAVVRELLKLKKQ